jgi:hypothetical protein
LSGGLFFAFDGFSVLVTMIAMQAGQMRKRKTLLYTTREAAELLGCSIRTIKRRVTAGSLEAIGCLINCPGNSHITAASITRYIKTRANTKRVPSSICDPDQAAAAWDQEIEQEKVMPGTTKKNGQ